MKTKSIALIGAAMVSCGVSSLLADDAVKNEQPVRDVAQPHAMQRTLHPGIPAKASQILGREITDGNGRKIGKVRDLALDLQNGRIVEVIVATGGFLGVRETDTAVPPEEFTWDPQVKKLTCQLDREELRYAPPFDVSHWSDSIASDRIREIYHRYNIAPYFIDQTVAARPITETKPAVQLTSAGMAVPTVHLGPIERARNIIGAPVQNTQDERLGKIENVIVDVADGRVVVLIVSTGGFLGMGNEVSAIPSQAFRYTADPSTLHLSATREALKSSPHFKPDQWPGVANPERVAMVYDAYHIPPYQNPTDADNTAQNVRDRSGSNVTPTDQGTSASDRAITVRIRRAIMSRSDLSIDAQNVKIITIDGHVTLRGPVKNHAEEQTIIEIARNAVTLDTKLTNQIQTINEPLKSIPSASDSN